MFLLNNAIGNYCTSQGLTVKLISLWNVLSIFFNNVFIVAGYLGCIVYYMLY